MREGGAEAVCSAPRMRNALPPWLLASEDFVPPHDRDRYISESMSSIATVLSQFRLDDGTSAPFSPAAPVKLFVAFACILMTSLSTNFVFTLIVLAGVLARLCLLPAAHLKRVVGVALVSSALTFALMVPAAFFGQPHSAVLLSVKVLVSVSIALTMAVTTPYNQLTSALRTFRVPSLFILTMDLALKNIVRLGEVALEVLTALKLRSVGRNARKGDAVGGVSGVVFLKSKESAEVTFDAMRCRGFDGEYETHAKGPARPAVDACWICLIACLAAAFMYLQGLTPR